MATVSIIGISSELTEQEIIDLEDLENREIVFDEDSPEMTASMLSQFHSFQSIPIRIDSDNYDVVRSFGNDIQGILSRVLNTALRDNILNQY